MRNVVRRSYLAKVNPNTINFEKVKMEIKRKIALIKSYRSKTGAVKLKLKRYRDEPLSANNNRKLSSKPYYSFFEEQERLNKNKYLEELENNNNDNVDSYLDDDGDDDYSEKAKRYYKDKMSSRSRSLKYDSIMDEEIIEDNDSKLGMRRKISDRILNKYNRSKNNVDIEEDYDEDYIDRDGVRSKKYSKLEEYEEDGYIDEDVENQDYDEFDDENYSQRKNKKYLKNKVIKYVEDRDCLEDAEVYKYSPAIINIKNIYPVRGGCGEKNKYAEENIIKRSRIKHRQLEEDTELDEGNNPRQDRLKNRYKNEDRGIENPKSRNFENKRNREELIENRRRRREDSFADELSENENDEFTQSKKVSRREIFDSRRNNGDCEGNTIVSINVASKKGISVEFDKKESKRRQYYED